MTITDPDRKRLLARIRADEVYGALERIRRERQLLTTLLVAHNPEIGDNATRRDCNAFKSRLEDLALWTAANKEAIRGAIAAHEGNVKP